jgi:hypothetical protein
MMLCVRMREPSIKASRKRFASVRITGTSRGALKLVVMSTTGSGPQKNFGTEFAVMRGIPKDTKSEE